MARAIGLAALCGALLAPSACMPDASAPAVFDPAAARKAASAYDARIIRDAYGVPHIYGKRNADVVFGLAYAHAEDDWKNIEEVIRSNRGTLGEILGEEGGKSDNFILSLGNTEIVNRDYAAKVSAAAKAIAEGYAAGINLWCADHADTGCARTMPVRGQDVIAGYANRPPSFYGLDAEIDALISGKADLTPSTKTAFLGVPDDVELGSNEIAVAPSRSADGHTRLAVNSHQPYDGRVAWYEARLKSEEGIDIIGGVFPGTPLILHGAGPKLGWAATVNKPDLYDTFKLTVDDEKAPTKYKMDGAWKDLTRRPIKYNVLKDGKLEPHERMGLWSEHGPAFVTEKGVYAVAFSGQGELEYLDQYLAMNMATTVDEWRAAQIKYNAIPSVNYAVADSGGHIAYFWNARMPKRVEGWDRKKVLPGDISETAWHGVEPVEKLPAVINPKSGYVVNSNHTPFLASATDDNPKPENYPVSFGVDTNLTNRGLRAQELFGGDTSITREEFLAYKLDHSYSMDSNVHFMVADLEQVDAKGDKDLNAEIALLSSWDGSADIHNRAAALAIFTGQAAMGGQINGEYNREKALTALKETAALLKTAAGRIDPEWGEVSRLQRGDKSWPLNGGPDTLRAVYAAGDLTKEKFRHGRAGDTYVIIADWAPDGAYTLDTIHQYGSATMDASSPHYADQAPLFAEEKFKRPPMELDALLKEATRDYRPGKEAPK
ncbi:MAG TPA: penicillin acylase family protein [Hyphomonadaceae bacterium]|nr:penicillin acylase family protein [Hyphomonadaceae bacterium]